MKKAAPGKESGLQNMPADYNHANSLHALFIQDELLPSIVRQASKQGDEPTFVALAVFLSLASALEANGVSREVLAQLAATPSPGIHSAPEGLQ